MVKPIKLLALLLTLTLLAVFVLTNVRDRLNDVLLSEKHLLSGYGTGCNELICQQLISLVNQNVDALRRVHNNVLNMMFDLGEYQADTATPTQIEDAWDMFNNYKVQLPYPNK